MMAGIAAGLTTGALWGLIFIAPLAVAPYSGVDLAIGRYAIFAATSLLIFLVVPASRKGGSSLREIALGIGLGMVGYGAFYGCLVVAVSHAGPQVPAAVIGLLPVLLAVAGNVDGGNMPWKVLLAPLILITGGLALIHGFALLDAESTARRYDLLFGIVAAFGSVAAWMCFSIFNARALARQPATNTLRWTGLHGVGAGLGIAVFAALAVPTGAVNLHELGWRWPDAQPLLLWSILTGLFGSYVASYLWVVATKRLPLVISGQLFIGEPAFGMLYGFIWERRWPSSVEAAGALCLFGGVMLGIAAFGRHRKQTRLLEAAV